MCAQAVRGVEAAHIISLDVVHQPGENISVFKDALSALETSLAYLSTGTPRVIVTGMVRVRRCARRWQIVPYR